MHKVITSFLFFITFKFALFPIVLYAQEVSRLQILPVPKQMSIDYEKENFFDLNFFKINEIYTAEKNKDVPDSHFRLIKEHLKKYKWAKIHFANKEDADLILEYTSFDAQDEQYNLVIENNKIKIKGSYYGVIFGLQTLFQIIHQKKTEGEVDIYLPNSVINDKPSFSIRSLKLDIASHFFNIDALKKVIDFLSLFKMKQLFLQFSSDNGWRMEMKSLSKLHIVGSFRLETQYKRNYNPFIGDGTAYGSFFSQKQLKELLEYGTKKNIMIIPSISFADGVSPFLASYPDLKCTQISKVDVNTSWAKTSYHLCAGKEKTYAFIKKMIKELSKIFPSDYFDLGTLLSNMEFADGCSDCKQFMLNKKMQNSQALARYFNQFIIDELKANNKKIIVNNHPDPSTSSAGLLPVFKGNSEEFSIHKNIKENIILSFDDYFYLDKYQSNSYKEPMANIGYLPMEKVYNFDLKSKLQQNKIQVDKILGIQAVLPTQFINDPSHLEYMLFSRLLAISTLAWNIERENDFLEFSKFLYSKLSILNHFNFNYSQFPYELHQEIIPLSTAEVQLKLTSSDPFGSIKYTDDSFPLNLASKSYQNPIILNQHKNKKIRAQFFKNDKIFSKEILFRYYAHKAVGTHIDIAPAAHQLYSPSAGAFNLINGIFADEKLILNEWYGVLNQNLEGIIDLGIERRFEILGLNFLFLSQKNIYAPKQISFYGSNDNKTYELIVEKVFQDIPNEGVYRIRIPIKGSYQYIKFFAQNKIADRLSSDAKLDKSYLLIDEIIIK